MRITHGYSLVFRQPLSRRRPKTAGLHLDASGHEKAAGHKNHDAAVGAAVAGTGGPGIAASDINA